MHKQVYFGLEPENEQPGQLHILLMLDLITIVQFTYRVNALS